MENAVRARELNEARRAAAEPAQAQRAGEAEVSEMEAQTEGTRYIAKHPEIAILATTQPIAFHAAMQKRAVQRQAIMDRFKMAQAQKDAPGMQAAQTELATLDAQPVTLEPQTVPQNPEMETIPNAGDWWVTGGFLGGISDLARGFAFGRPDLTRPKTPPAPPATQPVTAPQSAGPALPPQAWGEPIEQKMVGGQLTATNTRTGQKLVWKDGRWQPLA